jgi:iron-sulfur cluster assembly protein
MFGIPGKAAVTLTPAATSQIARLMAKQGSKGLQERRLCGDGIHDGLCGGCESAG